jgi:hypothetical protein
LPFSNNIVNREKVISIRDVVAVEQPTQNNYAQNMSITRRQETKRRQAMELRDNLLVGVHELEGRLDIEDRWVAGSDEWSDAAVLVSNRRYQRALDKLHALVIARLFELTKCNMSGTGVSQLSSSLCYADAGRVQNAKAHCQSTSSTLSCNQDRH